MISTLKGSVPPYLGVDLTEESHEREASGRTVLHFHCVVILRKRSLSLARDSRRRTYALAGRVGAASKYIGPSARKNRDPQDDK
jgi:hypothetical protein